MCVYIIIILGEYLLKLKCKRYCHVVITKYTFSFSQLHVLFQLFSSVRIIFVLILVIIKIFVASVIVSFSFTLFDKKYVYKLKTVILVL